MIALHFPVLSRHRRVCTFQVSNLCTSRGLSSLYLIILLFSLCEDVIPVDFVTWATPVSLSLPFCLPLREASCQYAVFIAFPLGDEVAGLRLGPPLASRVEVQVQKLLRE